MENSKLHPPDMTIAIGLLLCWHCMVDSYCTLHGRDQREKCTFISILYTSQWQRKLTQVIFYCKIEFLWRVLKFKSGHSPPTSAAYAPGCKEGHLGV